MLNKWQWSKWGLDTIQQLWDANKYLKSLCSVISTVIKLFLSSTGIAIKYQCHQTKQIHDRIHDFKTQIKTHCVIYWIS